MSLLDSNLDYSVTIGQKYMVDLAVINQHNDHYFHQSLWKDDFYIYDWAGEWGTFHKDRIIREIRSMPIEHLMCKQPYRHIRNILRSFAKPKFQWAAKLTPAQSQVSVRMGHPVVLELKVKDMGQSHWRPYMKIILRPHGQLTPF